MFIAGLFVGALLTVILVAIGSVEDQSWTIMNRNGETIRPVMKYGEAKKTLDELRSNRINDADEYHLIWIWDKDK